jgi:hypothetical protein
MSKDKPKQPKVKQPVVNASFSEIIKLAAPIKVTQANLKKKKQGKKG